jgi:hypothetical protein
MPRMQGIVSACFYEIIPRGKNAVHSRRTLPG